MMKRLLIITVLVFGVLVAFGQKNVSDKENETAPKTALIEVQKDYQKAVKEKNSPLLIQSLIRQIKYQSLIDIDSIPPMLQNLEVFFTHYWQNSTKCTSIPNNIKSTGEPQSRVTYLAIWQNGQVIYIEKKYSNTRWMQ